MSPKRKNLVYNILFVVLIVFLLSPFSLSVRSKINQGFIYLKSMVISPNIIEDAGRINLSTYNVNLTGINNAEDINLKKLKGEVIIINHWATWCPPCRAEMPSLDKLYKDYKDKIEFLFITSDEEREVSKYYKQREFNFPTYNLRSAIPKEISTSSIPATFIIDKKGRVVLEEFGPADWNTNKIRAMLEKLINE